MLFGKYINKYYVKYGVMFLIGIVALIIVDVAQLFIPRFLGDIVDILNNNDSFADGILKKEFVEQIILTSIYVVIIGIIMFGGRMLWRFTILRSSRNIESDLREEMFFKATRLSQRFYHENKVGNVLNTFTTDLDMMHEFFGFGTITLIDATFMTFLTIIIMFVKSWILTLIALIPCVGIVIWGFLAEKWMTIKWDERQKETDRLYDFSQETFTGIRVIKAFVKETQQLHTFAKIARKNQDVNVDFAKLSILFDIFISIIIAVIMSLILGFGSWLVYQGVTGEPFSIFNYKLNFSGGDLIEFVGYFETLIWPLMAMGQIFTQRSRAKASLQRITTFLDEKEEITNNQNAIILDKLQGKIEFKNFSFKYPDGSDKSLENINLIIENGQNIGIVGKIGSGKTTLVNSLLRLYNVEAGTLFIDDVDIMNLNIKFLRENIAFVPQDNFLFSDKIRNNIAFSDCEIEQEIIEDAAMFADVHSNIADFKDGYNTISGERGVTLSGGQKQRISIARAYIKDAPIMIMDDSVSAVDTKTERNILDNIKRERKGKTTIIVASRISTVKELDKILVLNNGEIEAFGTHDSLLKTSIVYRRMVELQQLEDEIKEDK